MGPGVRGERRNHTAVTGVSLCQWGQTEGEPGGKDGDICKLDSFCEGAAGCEETTAEAFTKT